MNLDLVNIIAAAVLIVPTATAGVLGWVNRSHRKRIKHLESCKASLSELLSAEKAATAVLLDSADHEAEAQMEETHQRYRKQLDELNSQLFSAENLIAHLELNPLSQVVDEDLAHVVKKEVTQRVHITRAAEVAANTHGANHYAHKLATAVGGACFRVVDHCKRGHGVFAEFPAYPKGDN